MTVSKWIVLLFFCMRHESLRKDNKDATPGGTNRLKSVALEQLLVVISLRQPNMTLRRGTLVVLHPRFPTVIQYKTDPVFDASILRVLKPRSPRLGKLASPPSELGPVSAFSRPDSCHPGPLKVGQWPEQAGGGDRYSFIAHHTDILSIQTRSRANLTPQYRAILHRPYFSSMQVFSQNNKSPPDSQITLPVVK